MEKIVANLSSNIKHKTMHGRDYIVAPVVMMVEGVLAGSAGPLLYGASEISKSVAAWNHKPITLGHPQAEDGAMKSGCDPDELEKSALGVILNTKYEAKTGKLKAEAWFDKSRLTKVHRAEQVLMALNSNQKMEVSTGLFVDVEHRQGEFKGRQYKGETKAYRPDHLAVLIGEPGASSIADGAGLLANSSLGLCPHCNAPGVSTERRPDGDIVCENDHKYPRSAAIHPSDEGEKEKIATNSESAKLIPNSTDANPTVGSDVPVTNQEQMSKETLSKHLGEAHKDFVANMTEDQAKAILALKPVETVTKEVPVQPVVNSMEDLLKLAPPAEKALLEQALTANSKMREGLVNKIVANTKNTFSADELNAFTTGALEKLAALADQPEQPVGNSAGKPDPIYAPPGGAPMVTNGQGLALPSTFAATKK